MSIEYNRGKLRRASGCQNRIVRAQFVVTAFMRSAARRGIAVLAGPYSRTMW
jgi:hypothetical protein